MMKRMIFMGIMLIGTLLISGCGAKQDENVIAETVPVQTAVQTPDAETEVENSIVTEKIELEDGVYNAKFDSDSGMFHINEAYEGKGTLTVTGGQAVFHMVMPSKNIVNLYLGLAEDAQKDGAELIQPVEEEVTYSDGFTETVYAFDVTVPVINQEFDLALIGKKGTWYDHKVSIKDVEKAE